MKRWAFVWVAFVFLLALRLMAQADCGVVTQITLPVDPQAFVLVQDYAVPSVRHQGRMHTGEDWFYPQSPSGYPVMAIANGRVVLSSPRGWGKDGGVVVLEHRLSNGDLFYSTYGHIVSENGVSFPDRFTCVGIGQPLGTITDVRPAPHLHFEIRTRNATDLSPGYTREHPDTLGYLRPSAFILNTQASLNRATVWRLDLSNGIRTAPLLLNDNSLLVIDNAFAVRRILPDGRILWRTRLDRPAVSITAYQGQSLLTFADGTMQLIDVEEGTLGTSWQINGVRLVGSPIQSNNWLIFPAEEQTLLAIDETRRNVLWTQTEVPLWHHSIVVNEGVNALIGLSTPDEVLLLSASGAWLYRGKTRYIASLAESDTQSLLAYSWGGIWEIDIAGNPTLAVFDSPRPTQSSALLHSSGVLFGYDGTTAWAYRTADKAYLWQTPLVISTAPATLTRYDNTLLLISQDGNVLTLNANTGQACAHVRVAVRNQAHPTWHTLANDGILRVAFAEQLLALTWERLKEGC